MSDEAPKKPKKHYVHYAAYVPDLVPAEDKTDNKKKVTCAACRQTLDEPEP